MFTKKIQDIDIELDKLKGLVEQTQRVYNKQLSTAIRIVPELSTVLYLIPSNTFQGEPEPETTENVNFYYRFSADLLIYKIVRWFSNGGKTCYTGGNDTFKLYPEIGVLTSLNIQKIDALELEDPGVTSHFIDAHIRKLLNKIDILFGLYNSEINSETEAYKKLHKF